MNPTELVRGDVRLVSLPEVCLRIGEMVDDPNVSAGEIGHVISQDAGLTARLLRVVNDAGEAGSPGVETVSRAVDIIGLSGLRALVLDAFVTDAVDHIPGELLSVSDFWRHSVYCGVLAQLLAEHCRVLHSERLFVAGLLHDIGSLILCDRLPERMVDVYDHRDKQGVSSRVAEREVLGFDHADVGGALLEEWKVPAALRDAVSFHHSPSGAGADGLDACLVHIADALAGEAELGLNDEARIQEIDSTAWATSGLDPSVAQVVLRDAGPRFSEALELVLPRAIHPN
ncbi:MAG TPA: HDOD domain-containing protein [Gammaproteobacteria bacterium]|nr:HDOD domain-containing protein [Gammaproteobacteria bacterium]